MDYYEETLNKIEDKIKKGNSKEAVSIIEEELKAPYLPKDFEEKIRKIYKDIKPTETSFKLDDDEIVLYLRDSKEKQLLAVDLLNKKNLREYTDLCSEYLSSEGFINAKVLLVDSLIRQEIGEEIRMENEGMVYEFIPKYLLTPEESDAFHSGSRYLDDYYMKEPSKNRIALDLLYKELMLNLPVNMDEEEGLLMAKEISAYIDKAFEASDAS